jgi:hypothetical protein
MKNFDIWKFSFLKFEMQFFVRNLIFLPYHRREMEKIEMKKLYISFMSPR